MPDDPIQVDVNDVIAELTPEGRREFELAQAKAVNKKLTALVGQQAQEIADLRSAADA